MIELMVLFVGLAAGCKALERWGAPLATRFRPRSVFDPSGVIVDPGPGHDGGGC